MKTLLTLFAGALISLSNVFSQDTFSIVAVDSVTGEVGSAGASCVDLFAAGLPNDDFIGVLVPGVGAINTQAYYLPANQDNATNQMNLGQTPSQIIQWLISNDVQALPEFRQYGIAALINGSPQVAAHTGSSTDNYKNHVIGPNYSIQGNILLGQEVLDSMEARFLNTEGDLACKLMAALQGANMVGADTRCAANGTSSLFAYVKVAQTTDAFGSPSFLASVRTSGSAGIEPIDSLQIKFDAMHSCDVASLPNLSKEKLFRISPNPTSDFISIESYVENCQYVLYNLYGETVAEDQLSTVSTIDLTELNAGIYILKMNINDKIFTEKIIKE